MYIALDEMELSYPVILHKINTYDKFDYSRFGDGEWNCIYAQERVEKGKCSFNCDGHTYFPDLSDRLRKVLQSRPQYYIGLQSLAKKQRPEQIDWWTKKYKLDWCESNILHNANIKGKIPALFEALERRDTLLVGPRHLHPLAIKQSWQMISIPDKNCWESYQDIKDNLDDVIDMKDWVVLYAASMMSNVLIDDYKGVATQIDIGSVLDPYVGVHSRSYHKTLEL